MSETTEQDVLSMRLIRLGSAHSRKKRAIVPESRNLIKKDQPVGYNMNSYKHLASASVLHTEV